MPALSSAGSEMLPGLVFLATKSSESAKPVSLGQGRLGAVEEPRALSMPRPLRGLLVQTTPWSFLAQILGFPNQRLSTYQDL